MRLKTPHPLEDNLPGVTFTFILMYAASMLPWMQDPTISATSLGWG